MLDILQAGPLTTVQDLGRPGWRHLGLPVGGAMDTGALQRANLLVGNAPGAAAIELCAGPLRLGLQRDAWLALQGAAFEPRVDGRPQPLQGRFPVRAGQEVVLQGPLAGQFAVLAVDGGVDLPPQLGARGTLLRGAVGGLEGRALRAGDRLLLGPARSLQGRRGLAQPTDPSVLGLLPGPELEELDDASRQRLWQGPWRVGPHSDRMGLRLAGPALRRQGLELLSHAVMPGLVQLPPDGQPIVLAADAQTTGGYPRLGQVIAADLWKLAQLRPGDPLVFVPTDLARARALQHAQAMAMERLRWALSST